MASNLPAPVLPSEEVEVGGVRVKIRSLTRAEAYQLTSWAGDEDRQESNVIAWGTDSSLAEAEAWRKASGFGTVTPLVDAILELSGLKSREVEVKDEDAPKD